ncbi:MAG: hypothetical protein M0D53_12560 [Flavobacterium sp. JAD_PAG50586_2]|nr:MAG: hypothetical protein M0D53_12560 [Flavobacterium sp. JAD_PAG50586_2]
MDTKNIIESVINYNMDVVTKRYAKEQDLPIEIAKEHEIELKRFLALCALKDDGTYSMRGPIDEFWHTFVVFTELYSEFCFKVANKFIHHMPNTDDPFQPRYSMKESETQEKDKEKVVKLREGYKKFLSDYEHIFQSPAPAHLWPRISEDYEEFAGAGCVCGCGCRCIA